MALFLGCHRENAEWFCLATSTYTPRVSIKCNRSSGSANWQTEWKLQANNNNSNSNNYWRSNNNVSTVLTHIASYTRRSWAAQDLHCTKGKKFDISCKFAHLFCQLLSTSFKGIQIIHFIRDTLNLNVFVFKIILKAPLPISRQIFQLINYV